MAADWLRPVFQRSRSIIPSAPSQDRYDENGPEVVDNYQRRSASRVSSFLNLHSASTSPTPSSDSTFLNFRQPDPDQVYEPSTTSMVETLKVIMMTRSSLEPVPVEYNAIILHVLEAYYDLMAEVTSKEQTIHALREDHAKFIKGFEALSNQWEEKQRNYKIDIKNLEVLLSRTVGGMDEVMITRTISATRPQAEGPVVTSSKRKIGTDEVSHSQIRDQAQPKYQFSEAITRSPTGFATDPVDYRVLNDLSCLGDQHEVEIWSGEQSQELAQAHERQELALAAFERQASVNNLGVAFGSIESADFDNSGNDSFPGEPLSNKKPLPATCVTDNSEQKISSRSLSLKIGSRRCQGLQHESRAAKFKRFSFQIGDEIEFEHAAPQTSSEKQECAIEHCSSQVATVDQTSSSLFNIPKSSRKSLKPEMFSTLSRSVNTQTIGRTSPKPSRQSRLARNESDSSVVTAIHEESPQRDDTQRSIVTAFKDTSICSSSRASRLGCNNVQSGLTAQKGPDYNDALAAAARAVSASKKTDQPKRENDIGSSEPRVRGHVK